MKIIPVILAASLLTLTPYAGVKVNQAHAQVNDHHSVPLAVIRFNQPRVYFQRPLSNAVKSALQVSRDVKFNIVQYNPQGAARSSRTERNLQAVLKQFQQLGVGSRNMQVNRQAVAGLSHSEVHVYVR